MNIEFYIPKDQKIPTEFRLLVDSIHVYYERIRHSYKFTVFTSDESKAEEIVNAVVSQIISDHDESRHGVRWETISLDKIDEGFGCIMYLWNYRVRDSY